MCMWIDQEENTRGHDLYPETVDAIENLLANLNGSWAVEVTVASDGTNEVFYFMAADHKVDWDEVDWGKGISVMCAMLYGDEGAEKEATFEVMATFQTDASEDYQKELEIITAMLHAWVEEKVFPNARMAVNIQDLLKVRELHDHLVNYPAYVWAREYRP